MDDSYYRALVRQVEAHKPLMEVINKIRGDSSTSHFLNLVDVEWESKLENNCIYRKLRDNIRNCFTKGSSSGTEYTIENMRPPFPLILLASCRFFKQVGPTTKNETAIVVQECEPLLKIINTMHSDLRSQNIYLRLDSKFTFTNCLVDCTNCSFIRQLRLKSGCHPKLVPPYGNVLPCPVTTPVYDGSSLRHSFVNEIQRTYSDTFLALLVVEITSRYKFADKYSLSEKNISHRVGGKVYKMVAFDEGKLYCSGMMNEDLQLSYGMEGYPHGDTLENGPETADSSVSHGKRQRQPHTFVESSNDEGCTSFSNWGEKRQKLDPSKGAAAKSDPQMSEAAFMSFVSENNSREPSPLDEDDDDKSLLDGRSVVAGASKCTANTKSILPEEGEQEDEEEDTLQFNIVEAYPSTCKMKPRPKLIANDIYEEFI